MFLESICFENGQAPLLEYHRHRVTKNLIIEKKHNDSPEEKYTIDAALSIMIFYLTSLTPPSKQNRFKCRIIYDPYHIENRTEEFIPYQIQPVKTLQLVSGKNIVYDRKYSDRHMIDDALKQKRSADDILIVRQGMITDTSYCNIVFFDGEKWFTPDRPLLAGTRRSYLLSLKVINEAPISIKDLIRFKSFKLINALRSFEEAEAIPIKKNILLNDKPIL